MARLHIDKDRAIYIGPLAQNTPHRHFAVQWSLALHGDETLSLRTQAGTTTAKSAVILPGVEHDLQCSRALTLLVHPLSELGLCLQNEPITSEREDAISAIRAAAEAGNIPLLIEELQDLTCAIPHPAIDGRIERTLHRLHGQPVLSADDAAGAVGLSTGRFLHLFKEETGMPYRRMLLWNRLRIFFAHIKTGADITTAALDAGFADSAHLSRSVRQAFGLTAREIAAALRGK